MKLLIAALLSVAFIRLTPAETTHINKQVGVPAKAHQAVLADKIITPQIQNKTEAAPVEAPAPTPAPAPSPSVPTTHEELMAAAGISPSDYEAVDYIVSHESTWGTFAQEPTSGAYGLCQSLPGDKMASAGSDWQTNPVTQLSWCNSYAISRYGGWWQAQAYWAVHRNW